MRAAYIFTNRQKYRGNVSRTINRMVYQSSRTERGGNRLHKGESDQERKYGYNGAVARRDKNEVITDENRRGKSVLD